MFLCKIYVIYMRSQFLENFIVKMISLYASDEQIWNFNAIHFEEGIRYL